MADLVRDRLDRSFERPRAGEQFVEHDADAEQIGAMIARQSTALLGRHAPVKAMPDGSWFLTRYRDILPVYRDPHVWSSNKEREFGPKYGATPLYEHHTTSLVFNDPPLHTRVRRAIVGALSQRHIAAMEPGLVVLVERLLDGLALRCHVDLIDEFAGAIPVEIIGNLLGVPRAEREPLRRWSLAILGALEPVLTPERADAGNRAVVDMHLTTAIGRGASCGTSHSPMRSW